MKSLLCGTDGVMDYPGLLNIGELSVIDALLWEWFRVQPCIRKYLLFSGVNRCVNHSRLRRGCLRKTFVFLMIMIKCIFIIASSMI